MIRSVIWSAIRSTVRSTVRSVIRSRFCRRRQLPTFQNHFALHFLWARTSEREKAKMPPLIQITRITKSFCFALSLSAHVGKRESRNAAIDTNYPHSKIILLCIFSERARRKERKPKYRHWYKLPAFQNHFKVKVFWYHFICIFSDRAHWKEESPNAAIDTNYPHSKIISE